MPQQHIITPSSPIIVIVGPTGSGKTKLAIDIAKEFNGEVIGLDSIQIYNRFCIGGAKPSPSQLDRIPHHLIDSRGFYKPLNVRRYLVEAKQCIDEILSRGKAVVICGGSFFYLSQLLIPTHCSNETLGSMVTGFVEDGDEGNNDNTKNDPKKTNQHESITIPLHPNALTPTPFNTSLNPNHCIDLNSYRNEAVVKNRSTKDAFELLYQIDQSHALHHRSNLRRLNRGLELYLEHGIPPTELYKNQNDGGSNDRDILTSTATNTNSFTIRYKCALISLTSSIESIAQRCTMRVCDMVKYQLPALNRSLQLKFPFLQTTPQQQTHLLNMNDNQPAIVDRISEQHWLYPYLHSLKKKKQHTTDNSLGGIIQLLYKQFTSTNLLAEAYCLYMDTVYLRSISYLSSISNRNLKINIPINNTQPNQNEIKTSSAEPITSPTLGDNFTNINQLDQLIGSLPPSLKTDSHLSKVLLTNNNNQNNTPPHSSLPNKYGIDLDLANLGNIDIGRGIWQGIGFAEFLPWFKWLTEYNYIGITTPCQCIMDAVERSSRIGKIEAQRLLLDGIGGCTADESKSESWLTKIIGAIDEPCFDLYGLTSPCFQSQRDSFGDKVSKFMTENDDDVKQGNLCPHFQQHVNLLTLFLTPTPLTLNTSLDKKSTNRTTSKTSCDSTQDNNDCDNENVGDESTPKDGIESLKDSPLQCLFWEYLSKFNLLPCNYRPLLDRTPKGGNKQPKGKKVHHDQPQQDQQDSNNTKRQKLNNQISSPHSHAINASYNCFIHSNPRMRLDSTNDSGTIDGECDLVNIFSYNITHFYPDSPLTPYSPSQLPRTQTITPSSTNSLVQLGVGDVDTESSDVEKRVKLHFNPLCQCLECDFYRAAQTLIESQHYFPSHQNHQSLQPPGLYNITLLSLCLIDIIMGSVVLAKRQQKWIDKQVLNLLQTQMESSSSSHFTQSTISTNPTQNFETNQIQNDCDDNEMGLLLSQSLVVFHKDTTNIKLTHNHAVINPQQSQSSSLIQPTSMIDDDDNTYTRSDGGVLEKELTQNATNDISFAVSSLPLPQPIKTIINDSNKATDISKSFVRGHESSSIPSSQNGHHESWSQSVAQPLFDCIDTFYTVQQKNQDTDTRVAEEKSDLGFHKTNKRHKTLLSFLRTVYPPQTNSNDSLQLLSSDSNAYFKKKTVHHCVLCDVVIVGDAQLALHNKGKPHRAKASRAKQPLSAKELYEKKLREGQEKQGQENQEGQQ